MATRLRELEVDLITRGHLERGIGALREQFAGTFSPETIERYMVESLEALPAARVESFVPLLVHRFARERLRALAQAEGKSAKDVPEVLFVCVHNAGRSQMAAALLDHYADGAGPREVGRQHARRRGEPGCGDRDGRAGTGPLQEFPKPMTDEFVRAADVVITMGCGDACPIYPGKRYEDWELDDPAEADLDGVRTIRDELARRVGRLVDELAPTPAP